jgi:VWFA-related protein
MSSRRMLLALLAVGLLRAQSSPPPTFKTGTKLVQVDVVPRDKNGPVVGLTKQDFTLLDNGKPQEIAVFSVKGSIQSTQVAKPAAAVPLAPGAVSNRENSESDAAGTQTVILIDQKNLLVTDQQYAITRIVKFIQSRRKQDRIGIYAFGKDGLRSVQELTGDQELLNRAARSLKPRDPTNQDTATTGMTVHEATEFATTVFLDRALDTKQALQAVARHLTKVPGRKNLIWITQGFPLKSRNFDFTSHIEEAARALNDANVALYGVDARGLIGALSGGTSGGTGMPRGIANAETGPVRPTGPFIANGPVLAAVGGVDTMFILAGLTGGEVYLNTNGIEDSIRSAVEDAELTYTLGFYPSDKMQDGQTHQLNVKVARRGVSVRYRENYSALNASTVAVERPTLDQLMADSLDATQIGLTVQATPDPTRPGWFNIRVSVDLHDLKLEHEGSRWTGAIELSIHPEGSIILRKINHKIEIPEDQLAVSLENGIEIETPIEASGVLRVVVQDGGSPAAGSVRIRP